MSLCKYKNMLGIPGQGIHSFRIFNIAVVDVVLTIILSYIISYISNKSFLWTLLIVFIIGIILHRVFCVKTTIDKFLFQNNNNL